MARSPSPSGQVASPPHAGPERRSRNGTTSGSGPSNRPRAARLSSAAGGGRRGRLHESRGGPGEQAEDQPGDDPDDQAEDHHEHPWGDSPGRHRRLLGVTRHVPIEEDLVGSDDPHAVHHADQKAMEEWHRNTGSGNDHRTDDEDRRHSHRQPEEREGEDQFPVHGSAPRRMADTLPGSGGVVEQRRRPPLRGGCVVVIWSYVSVAGRTAGGPTAPPPSPPSRDT